MKPFLASLALLLVTHSAYPQLYPFPTEATRLGAAGTPGDLDKEFKSLIGTFSPAQNGSSNPGFIRFDPDRYTVAFEGNPDIRTAMVQADGKILIGGSFRIRQEIPQQSITTIWRNLARLNPDGTLDNTFISASALEARTRNGSVVFGPDGAVYSILVVLKDDLFQYLVAGDFLNFSHNALGNPAPRLRYLMLDVLAADPAAGPNQPLVALSDNVSDGDGFNGPVRKIRRLFGTLQGPNTPPVFDRPERLRRPYPIGTRLYQLDNGFLYEKISGPLADSQDRDWEVIPAGRRPLYFAAGDFTSFVNDPDERFITRFDFNPGGITILRTEWETPPIPNKRVWDVTALGPRIFFVGEFDTINAGALQWRKIAVIDETGATLPDFDPGAGFNDTAMSIVADPIQNNVVVAGYFTDYDGNTVGRIARVNVDGSMVAGFPAANNGNSDGANGPIRCVTRQPDGRLIIAGEFTRYNGINRAGIARLEADGSLDETFVPQGRASGIQNFAFDIDGGPATASLFARPIAVGNFKNLFGSKMTGVARFIGGSFPVIWYQPNQLNAPYAVVLGESKRISVVATDNFVGRGVPPFEPVQTPSEPLLYQWQKNGKNIEGEVLPYLDIDNFEPADAGKYRVQIWNSQFLILSETVTLAWIAFPGIPESGLRAQGLIEANPTLNGDLGGSIVFNITRTGFVTGTITLGNLGGRPYVAQFRGQYNYVTGLTVQIRRPNQSPLTLRLKTQFPPPEDFPFDFSGPDNSLSDSFGNVAAISAAYIPWSKNEPATAYAGNYNIGLETDPAALSEMMDPAQPEELQQPLVSQGFGFLSMRIAPATGQARITGLLADGTKITAASAVRNNVDGSVPLWIPLYGTQGALGGTLAIQTEADQDGILPPEAVNPVLAELRWSKPPGVPKSPNAAGFSNVGVNAANGSGLYKPDFVPASFVLGLNFGDGAWADRPGSLDGGGFSQDFQVNGGRGAPLGDNPQATTFGFVPATGIAKGGFVNADTFDRPRKVTYHAITLTGGGFPEFYGFFVMPNAVKNTDFWVGGSVTGGGF